MEDTRRDTRRRRRAPQGSQVRRRMGRGSGWRWLPVGALLAVSLLADGIYDLLIGGPGNASLICVGRGVKLTKPEGANDQS